MLLQGVHPKIVSERLGHSSIGITLDTSSHALVGSGVSLELGDEPVDRTLGIVASIGTSEEQPKVRCA